MRIIQWQDNQKYHICRDIGAVSSPCDITHEDWLKLSEMQYIPNTSDGAHIIIFEGTNVDPDKRMIYRNVDGCVNTSNWVGVISPNSHETDLKLKISSRFDNAEKQYFLMYLLSKVYGFNMYNNRIESNRDCSFNGVIVILFLAKLEEAFADGLFKQYKRINHNDYDIRGTIDFARHIKLNVPFVGKTAYTNRELLYDNDILCLIRQTLDYVKSKYPRLLDCYLSNHSNFYEIERVIEEATPSYRNNKLYNLSTACLKEITNPLYLSYELVRVLCLNILCENFDHFYEENNSESISILFDVSWLWEEFVWNTLLSDAKQSVKYDHLGRKIKNDNSYIGGIRYSNQANSWYPDFIEKNKTTGANNYLGSTVLDAKYKNWDYNRNDMQQLISYLYITGGSKCGAIYPIKETENTKTKISTFTEYRELNEYSAVLNRKALPRCYKMPFVVPEYSNATDYDHFCKQMETNIVTWKNSAKTINIL